MSDENKIIKEKELEKIIKESKGMFSEKDILERLKKDIPEFKANEELTITPKEVVELYHEYFDMFIEQVMKTSVQVGERINQEWVQKIQKRDTAKEILNKFREEQKKRTTGTYNGCYCDGCVDCMQISLKTLLELEKRKKP